MARSKYDYFASAFRKAGYVQIANIFEETAKNEKEHAKLWAKQLGYIHENLEENLQAAIDDTEDAKSSRVSVLLKYILLTIGSLGAVLAYIYFNNLHQGILA